MTQGRLLEAASIPIYLECSTVGVMQKLETLCRQVGFTYEELTSEKRRMLHLSAVIVNNFTNHLLHKAFDLAHQHGVSKGALLPLLDETIAKFEMLGGEKAQTGPAKRNDISTLRMHLEMLTDLGLQKIYSTLSESIKNDFNA